jgi:hypothetical protein
MNDHSHLQLVQTVEQREREQARARRAFRDRPLPPAAAKAFTMLPADADGDYGDMGACGRMTERELDEALRSLGFSANAYCGPQADDVLLAGAPASCDPAPAPRERSRTPGRVLTFTVCAIAVYAAAYLINRGAAA